MKLVFFIFVTEGQREPETEGHNVLQAQRAYTQALKHT